MRSLLPLTLPLLLVAPANAEPLTLADGDRVVLLGNTLIEREQKYGWWELALTARFPGKKLTVRNLGWSGDTVFGDARAGFGTAADGFKEMTTHTLALKPTVIFLAYGTNESFAGPDGLEAFTKGLNKLLDALGPAKAKIILLGPMRQSRMSERLPDPAKANKNLDLYAGAMKEVAKKRKLAYHDLGVLLGDLSRINLAVSENGIHLNDAGYRWSAGVLMKALGHEAKTWTAEVDASDGTRKWVRTDKTLPTGLRMFKVTGLPAGKYDLKIDGVKVATAEAAAWGRGVLFGTGPDYDQLEKLRRAIIAKNELYFHRWRPQNVTYLFGFRKHEQGKNATDIPKFDPLVAAKEKEIAKLAGPVARSYEVVAVE